MPSKSISVASVLTLSWLSISNVLADGPPDGLADPPPPASDGLLYSVDHNTGNLITIDPNSAMINTVGPTGFEFIEGLTYHAPTDTLLGVDNASDQLVSINRYTGAGAAVGAIGRDFVFGLTYSETSDTLYGFDTQANELLSVDPTSGATALVTPTSYDFVGGLTDNPTTGILYGVDYSQDAIFSIVFDDELGPGISAPIVDVPLSAIQGLAFDTTTEALFAVNIEVGPDELLRINRFTDTVSLVGPLDGVALASLEFVPHGVPEPTALATLLVGVGISCFVFRTH
jgi:hypothetical protein